MCCVLKFNLFNVLARVLLLHLASYASTLNTVDMSAKCGEIYAMAGIDSLRLTASTASFHSRNFGCTVTFKTDPGHRFMVQFKELHVTSNGQCVTDWLNLHDGSTIATPSLVSYKFCGYTTSSPIYVTSRNMATIYFHGNQNILKANVFAIITKFHIGHCHTNEIACDNGRCVAGRLRRDGFNPCGDHSDCDGPTNAVVEAVLQVAAVTAVTTCAGLAIIGVVVIVVRRRRTKLDLT